MANIDQLRQRYFVNATDVSNDNIEGEQVPDESPGNRVTHLIDGNGYFGALRKEIDELRAGGSNRYFYLANWRLGLAQGPTVVTTESAGSAWTAKSKWGNLPPFKLDDGSSQNIPLFIDELEQMAQNGIDVRVLVWVSPFILNNEKVARNTNIEPYWTANIHSLLSVQELRTRHGMDVNVVLNTLAHPVGAMHVKIVVCGDESRMHAYVSGLDFVSNRIAGWEHPTDPQDKYKGKWHDVGVKIEGPAAGTIYRFYQALWNEQLKRDIKTFRISRGKGGQHYEVSSHNKNTKPISDRSAPAVVPPGTQHVQVLRTVPQMNFATVYSDQLPKVSRTEQVFARLFRGFGQKKLSFAEHGIFEFRAALYKAISHAQSYIYIEDPNFYGIEVMRWINERLHNPAQPPLKVILLFGADPSDPPSSFLPEAIDYLLYDIENVNDQVVFYLRGGNVTTHGKVAIIDDAWAVVGSANCATRRSLYMDGECSIAVLDADESNPSFAQRLRKDLWGEHCGKEPGVQCDGLLDLATALGIWNPDWSVASVTWALKSELQRMNLPFQYADPPGPGQWKGVKAPDFDEKEYDIGDGDSRKEY